MKWSRVEKPLNKAASHYVESKTSNSSTPPSSPPYPSQIVTYIFDDGGRGKGGVRAPTTSYKDMEVQVRNGWWGLGKDREVFYPKKSPSFSRDDVHKSGRSIVSSVSSFKWWWFQLLFCGVFTPQKNWAQYVSFFFGGKAMSSVDVCGCFQVASVSPQTGRITYKMSPGSTYKWGVTPVTQLSGHWFKGPRTTLINGSPFFSVSWN